MHTMTFPSRFISIFTAFALVFTLFGGFFVGVPSSDAHTAILGDFVNNGAAGGNIVGGRTNLLALDITLPAADDELFLDGDGSDSTAAGAQAAIANGAAFVRFVLADNICARDADGGAVPDANAITSIWLDDGVNEANCGVDGAAETMILGAAGAGTEVGVGASTLTRMVHSDPAGANVYNRTGDVDASNDEDIYDDVDRSLFYRADAVHAVVVENAGTAVDTTDIVTVMLWLENGGGAGFQSGSDLLLAGPGVAGGARCFWNAAGASWDCRDDTPATDTLVLITGLVAPRIYVTIDTALSPTVNRTVQMRVPTFADGDADSRYDANEDGIFFSNAGTANVSRHDGPPGAAVTNANLMTFIGTSSGGGSTTTPPSDSPPPAPSGISATAGEGKVDLAWTNTSEADFASVKIYRSEVHGTLGTAIASGLTGTTYSDTSVTGGTTYHYTVRSVDAGGNESTNTTQVMATPTGAAAPPAEETPTGEETTPSASSPQDASVADGTLVRSSGATEVYVTKKVEGLTIVRHIVTAGVFDVYPHLGGSAAWSAIVGVDSLGSSLTSSWVRGADGKVWEVNGDGTRHHMQMTWEQFAGRVAAGDSSLATNLIFEVNAAELGLYSTGVAVLP